ncbi:MAG: NTPase [Candidatus Abyssobacteria bacterium SURF_5]|uniref:NTPase n=1 Tax=Abyssobacteria bacterium (strain SURF_5) TaxID=2093360 RepID=A0A3A4P051_ABYX5|nr:MAG: NTPase [Candidatus Abyssubacteria bacterium SURF_5]
MSSKILLTGAPGIGKTTAIRKVAEGLGARASGFYTEEMREGGRRVGFEIVTLDGRRAPLSHIGIPGKQRVGRYGVDTESMDSVAVPAIKRAIEEGHIVIIDEIGKMELFSHRFRQVVLKAFGSSSPVVAVIMAKPNPFADSLKERDDADLIELTHSNRDSVPAKIIEDILFFLRKP